MDRLKVLLNGEFFTYWNIEQGLADLARFSNLDVAQLSWDPEELARYEREVFKEKRQENVERIRVTISNGREFDGDETSQNRMARALTLLNKKTPDTTTLWILANNEVVQVTSEELYEALELAGLEQTKLWPQGDS